MIRFVIILVLFIPFVLSAQEEERDSVRHAELPLVTVKSENTTGPVSTPTPYIQKYVGQSLVDALEESGMLFIKTYGLGSLATASLRGGAAGQTAITWNGIALQSPMLGLVDLSLIPTIHIDQAQVDGGGQSAAMGSGAVAGSISFKTDRPDTAFRMAHHFTTGSFGLFHSAHRLSGGTEKLRFKLSAQFDKATNDFPFRLRDDLPEQRLSHAEFQQQAWQQSVFWDFHPKHRLTAHAWQQTTNRNLPPTTVENLSLATQEDQFWRQQLIWQARGRKAVWENQLAYNKEDIYYQDPIAGIDAPSTFNQLTWQSKRYQTIGNLDLESGLQYIRASAEAKEYRQIRLQEQKGLYQRFTYHFTPTFKHTLLARIHQIDDHDPLWALRVEMSKEFPQYWRVSGAVSRDFRVPTLNDLYWIPGGNPDLKTELSWAQELEINKYDDEGRYFFGATVYNRMVDNWIQWAQQDGNVFWSAGNVTRVWSRGLEFTGILSFPTGRGRLDVDARYNYTKSTYEEAVVNPAIEKGTQLWYTPIHLANLQLSWEVGHFLFRYTHRYVSETEGVNADLAAYQLGDFHLIWQKLEKETGFRCFLEVNNLWNTTYRVIERRAMPGRHLRVGIQTDFLLKT
ncbi:TonB-dependent receptor plug domain-containing protein [Lewinella cohaerens]|uniref:TonB-dependent receptor plug domain-containing protein n=1 Tax=Lewinella cohaerens TaxID=70995 RepID=UPI0004766B0D|nr:TonB-dependent receptor plug domain-containing protein [Lewinella cohaerens]